MNELASSYSLVVEACQGITALGNAAESARALADGTVALRLHPCLGTDGGDEVPLALIGGDLCLTHPPRWLDAVSAMVAPVRGAPWGRRRTPVVVTSSNFGIERIYAYRQHRSEDGLDWGNPHGCVEALRREFGWEENVTIFSHACVSAQLGLLHAARLLEAGEAEAVLLFSFDFLSAFVCGGFHALKILNHQLPAPYARREIGSIGLGDGAAWAVLRPSGTTGPATIVAQHCHNEMHHFTANRDDGSGFDALLTPLREHFGASVDWIKGHGTGTLQAGELEASACARHFPERPLVAWKGSLGHTLGSCALVELAVSLAALSQSRIPGTVGTTGECFAREVRTDAFTPANRGRALHLSNAFGGAHAAMIVDYA